MLSMNEVVALCAKIYKSGKALDSQIQKAFQAAVYYSVCHGDVTAAQKLLESLNKGSRKNSLIVGLEKMGQVQFDKETKTMVYRKRDDLFESYHEKKDEAEAYAMGLKHWTEFVKEPSISIYDCEDQVKKLLARMEKAIDGKNAKNTKIYDVIVEAVKLYEEEVADAGDEAEQKAA